MIVYVRRLFGGSGFRKTSFGHALNAGTPLWCFAAPHFFVPVKCHAKIVENNMNEIIIFSDFLLDLFQNMG